MTDLWPVQEAVYTALNDGTYPVYDGAAPQGEKEPYVIIGEPTQNPGEEMDTPGSNATLTLHGWSTQGGKEECYAIQQWIAGHLDHQTIAGAWACFEEFATIRNEGSANTPRYHLITRYRIRT